MEKEDIIIVDCGLDMDKIIGPLGCCGAAFAPFR